MKTIGGQALIEGIMMRTNDKYSICVRLQNKKLITKVFEINQQKFLNLDIMKIPIIRGIARFIETLVIGTKALLFSASFYEDSDIKENNKKKEKKTNSKKQKNFNKLNESEIIITIVFSLMIAFSLFYFLPLFIAKLTNTSGLIFHLIEGIVRLLIFFIYLFLISLMPDIKKVFQYHGAEHMTVHCYEHNEKLTIKNIKKYETLHPRCGTNFILIVFIFSIIIFSFINHKNFLIKLIIRILLIPIIAGISYEFLKFSGKHINNPIVKILNTPGMFLQKITTKKPNDEMIKVAIKALNAIK